MTKPYLSASRLNMLARCGLQYKYRYEEGIIAPPSGAMLVGKATHEAIEANLRAKMAGESCPVEEVVELAHGACRRMWAESPPVDAGEDLLVPADDAGKASDLAGTLARLHAVEVAPALDPVAVEERCVLALEGPFDVVMVKDVVERDGTVRDTKTSGRSPAKTAAETSDQLALYSAHAAAIGKPALRVVLDYLVATKQPKYVPLAARLTDLDHARVLHRVRLAGEVIRAGNFMPAASDNWCCSPARCGYWSMCPCGAAAKAPVVRAAADAVGVEVDDIGW